MAGVASSSKLVSDPEFTQKFHQAVISFSTEWTILPVVMQTGSGPQGGLCRADRGIALIGRDINLAAVLNAKQVLLSVGFEEKFGSLPPIVYRTLPPPDLPLAEVLEAAFDLEPPLKVADPAEWLRVVIEAFAVVPGAQPDSRDTACHVSDGPVEAVTLQYPASQAPLTDRPSNGNMTSIVAPLHQSTFRASPLFKGEAVSPNASGQAETATQSKEPAAKGDLSTTPKQIRFRDALLVGSTAVLIVCGGLAWAIMHQFDGSNPLSRMAGDGTGASSTAPVVVEGMSIAPSNPGRGLGGQGTGEVAWRPNPLAPTHDHPERRVADGVEPGHKPEADNADGQSTETPTHSSQAAVSPGSRMLPDVHHPTLHPPLVAPSTVAMAVPPVTSLPDGLLGTRTEASHPLPTPPFAAGEEGRIEPEMRLGERSGHHLEVAPPSTLPSETVPSADRTNARVNTSAAPPNISSGERSSQLAVAAIPFGSLSPAGLSTFSSPDEAQPEASTPAAQSDIGGVERPSQPPIAITPPDPASPPPEPHHSQTVHQSAAPTTVNPDDQPLPERALSAAPVTQQPPQSLAATASPPLHSTPPASSSRNMPPDLLTNLLRRGQLAPPQLPPQSAARAPVAVKRTGSEGTTVQRQPANSQCTPLLSRLQLGERPTHNDLLLLRSACAPRS
jgi:hypothetical protein